MFSVPAVVVNVFLWCWALGEREHMTTQINYIRYNDLNVPRKMFIKTVSNNDKSEEIKMINLTNNLL